MKTVFLNIVLLSGLAFFPAAATGQSTNTFWKASDKALATGKDAMLNVGFARVLGLNAQQGLPLKRLQIERDGVIHVLDVLRDRTNVVVVTERREMLATFYLTDRSGALRKAVVNDGAVANGGLTNLSIKVAAEGFEKVKGVWIEEGGR